MIYSKIVDLIECLARNDKVGGIHIASNGTVVPNDELLDTMHRFDVTLRISDYNVGNVLISQIVDKCKKKKVRYEVYRFAGRDGYWYDLGGPNVAREENEKAVKIKFDSCIFNTCMMLEHNRLSRCSRAVNASSIQKFCPQKGDFVLIKGNERLKKDLMDYIQYPRFMEACRYCNGTEKKCVPAEQL